MSDGGKRASPIPKVSSFVLDPEPRLLVFTQPEAPEAGVQVPAGTIEPGEDPAAAAVREAEEETGYAGFRLVRLIDRQLLAETRNGRDEQHDRFFFHLAPPRLPERWRHGEHHAADSGELWIPFDFFWIDPTEAPSPLTPEHAAVLERLLDRRDLDRLPRPDDS